MHRTIRQRILWGAVTFLLLAIPAWAQTSTGNLYGTVRGDDAAPLPGVTVTLSSESGEQIAITSESGEFRFLGLDPGNYKVEASLDGFGSMIYEAVNIRIGRNTTLELQLNPAVEDTIVVTSESPLLDERKISQGIEVTQLELQKIPTSRDPWAIAGQTPGVLMDRINVGGNESGQQPNFVGSGSNSSQNKFMIDGVDVSDQSAVGGSATYFGFEQFEEMSFSTGGTDVTISTPGVQLNMVTKRGTNEWRGSGSYNLTDEEYQASDNLDRGDLAPGQAADGDALTGNQIDRITQWGGEVGGFVIKDRLWIWGAIDENDIQQSVFGGGFDNTLLENQAVKLNAQVASNNSFVYTWNNGEKVKNGRDAGPSRPPETTFNQGGPSPLQKAEDTHVFSSSFFVSASWSEMKGGFFLEPQGGRDAQIWQDAGGVYRGSFFYLDNKRPTERWKADGSSFFETGGMSHELKFGYSYRTAGETSTWGAPGTGLLTYNVDDPETTDNEVLGYAWRESNTDQELTYQSLWLQDTLTTDRLTVNVGIRYDKQEHENLASASPALPFDPELLPALSFDGNQPDFAFEDIVPRLGLTYALGAERKTLLRASYSQFADQLGVSLGNEVNPLGSSFAIYAGNDANGNGILDPDEPRSFIAPVGFDPANPTSTETVSRIDPNIDAVVTDELILGLEHAFRPEFVGGFTLTYRNAGDYYHEIPIFRDAAGNEVLLTRDDYVLCTEGCSAPGSNEIVNGQLQGTLPDGTAFSTPVYRVRDGLTDTGGIFFTNTDRSTEYLGYSVSATKRLSDGWMLRAHVTYYDWEWDIGSEFRRFDDPTNGINDNSDFHEWFVDDDGAIFAEQSGGSGGVSLFLNSRWSFNVSGLYQLPWGLNVSANINGREGYPLAWYVENVSTPDGTADVQAAPLGRDRVDDIITTDVRVDKDFTFGDLSMTVSVDVFNLFNEGYVLQREYDLSVTRAGFVDQIIGPRVARFGVRFGWK